MPPTLEGYCSVCFSPLRGWRRRHLHRRCDVQVLWVYVSRVHVLFLFTFGVSTCSPMHHFNMSFMLLCCGVRFFPVLRIRVWTCSLWCLCCVVRFFPVLRLRIWTCSSWCLCCVVYDVCGVLCVSSWYWDYVLKIFFMMFALRWAFLPGTFVLRCAFLPGTEDTHLNMFFMMFALRYLWCFCCAVRFFPVMRMCVEHTLYDVCVSLCASPRYWEYAFEHVLPDVFLALCVSARYWEYSLSMFLWCLCCVVCLSPGLRICFLNVLYDVCGALCVSSRYWGYAF